MRQTHRIAVIAGDGIGKEVMPEGLRVLDACARKFGIRLVLDNFDWSCDRARSCMRNCSSATTRSPPCTRAS